MSSVWANLGFTFILVTAGLQSIPRDLHEAAAVDGAGGIRRFWSITVPMLGPTLLFVVIVSTTRAFQAYGEVDLLTGGGPQPENPTTTIPYFIYGQNSPIRNDVGLQAGAAVLLFLLLLVLSGLQLAGIGRRVHYERLICRRRPRPRPTVPIRRRRRSARPPERGARRSTNRSGGVDGGRYVPARRRDGRRACSRSTRR